MSRRLKRAIGIAAVVLGSAAALTSFALALKGRAWVQEAFPDTWRVVSGAGTVEEVAGRVREAYDRWRASVANPSRPG